MAHRPILTSTCELLPYCIVWDKCAHWKKNIWTLQKCVMFLCIHESNAHLFSSAFVSRSGWACYHHQWELCWTWDRTPPLRVYSNENINCWPALYVSNLGVWHYCHVHAPPSVHLWGCQWQAESSIFIVSEFYFLIVSNCLFFIFFYLSKVLCKPRYICVTFEAVWMWYWTLQHA